MGGRLCCEAWGRPPKPGILRLPLAISFLAKKKPPTITESAKITPTIAPTAPPPSSPSLLPSDVPPPLPLPPPAGVHVNSRNASIGFCLVQLEAADAAETDVSTAAHAAWPASERIAARSGRTPGPHVRLSAVYSVSKSLHPGSACSVESDAIMLASMHVTP